MKVEHVKNYTKFLEKCESNALILLKSYSLLTFSAVVVQNGENSLYHLGEVNTDFREIIETFVKDLESADTITIQIEHEQRVMQAIPFSFNPPTRQANMEQQVSVIDTMLGNLPKPDQMLGTILQLNGKMELESMKAEYERKLQDLVFDKRELNAKKEALEEKLKEQAADFEAKEKRYRAKLRNSKNTITNYQSEEKTLGNINLIKGISKEVLGAFMLFKAADTESEKKEEKYMTMAGMLSGAPKLPENTAQVAQAFIAAHHDGERKDSQANLFQYFDSLDKTSYDYLNTVIDFLVNDENKVMIQKYIIPIVYGTFNEAL